MMVPRLSGDYRLSRLIIDAQLDGRMPSWPALGASPLRFLYESIDYYRTHTLKIRRVGG